MEIKPFISFDGTPGMLGNAGRRIMKEIDDLVEDCPDFMKVSFPTGSALDWLVTLYGPEATPYEGGLFKVSLKLPTDYPFKPPRVNFTTKMYHPNIDRRGNISIDILQEQWSPALTVAKVMISLLLFIQEPNPLDPLVPDIAMQYMKDYPAFEKAAREWTE
jgi:ubiquitin-conjugating enzyme E2 D/E